jgi:hypothetical protein
MPTINRLLVKNVFNTGSPSNLTHCVACKHTIKLATTSLVTHSFNTLSEVYGCINFRFVLVAINSRGVHLEFLTHKTTCANVMSKRTTYENICQKDHLSVAVCLARRHVARAAWADAGMGMPPQPTPTCGLAVDSVDRR